MYEDLTMGMKNKKAVIALRIIFAIVVIAYLVGTVLAVYVFDFGDLSLALRDKGVVKIPFGDNSWKLQLWDAKTVSVEQILWTAFPGVLFVFSAIGWSLDKQIPKKTKKQK